jgi:parallel beta-helix repeat protein
MSDFTLITTIYVNPATGNDANAGSRLAPFKTITKALKVTTTPAIIQLSPGTYSTATGDRFPLVIPEGVMLLGNEATKGQGILISGGGEYNSSTFGIQNITLMLLDEASLLGVTVTNSTAKGTGVWIESTAPILSNNTFTGCGREGVFVSGKAKPLISGNLFTKNASGGLVFSRNSKGEVLRNIFQNNPLGLAISDFAAPLVANNKVSENQNAIALSREASPVLRNNLITQNSQGGLLVNGNANPDLGNSQDPAGNFFQDNGGYDLQNATSNNLISVGNQLNPSQVKGNVDFVAITQAAQIKVVNSRFADTIGHWAAAFIEVLVNQGVMGGLPDGSFAPDAPINRAQYASVITKAFNLTPGNKVPNFTDVKPDFWAATPINAAASNGFLSGFPDNTFRPSQNITKIQAILALVNGLQLNGGSPSLLSVYSDRAQIPSYATNAIATATSSLMVVNYPQTEFLEPLKEITRAEVAVLINQALVLKGKFKPIFSPYIVSPNTAEITSFRDLTGHWAEEFIRALVSMNLTSGYTDGTYQPDKPMTRAQYAALVAAAFKPTPKRQIPDFSDVPQDFWAYQAIKVAAAGGFVGGFSDRTFKPNQNVQRLQVIVSLVSGLGIPPQPNNTPLPYSDKNLIPNSAVTAVATATAQNIIINYPDTKQIQPNREASRGEVAAMVYQALTAINRTAKINSPYIVSNFAFAK